MTEKYIRSFTVRGPDGVPYLVDYFWTFVVFPSAIGRDRRVAKRLLKCKGQLLRRIEPGVYEMDAAGGPVRLTFDDPDAK